MSYMIINLLAGTASIVFKHRLEVVLTDESVTLKLLRCRLTLL